MADSKTTLKKRVISAVLGAALILGLIFYGNITILIVVCAIVSLLAVREFSRMIFGESKLPESASHAYRLICALAIAGMILQPQYGLPYFCLAGILIWLSCLWLARNRATNEDILTALGLGTFGLLYCVLFPVFAIELIRLPDGNHWFLFLLILVFFGDIFAYFGGSFWGSRKLMPQVSPNKSWEGAVSGLFGSALAGGGHLALRFHDVSIWKTVLFCLICGAVAQSGDLLMSLVKRVAHVKDSGTLMPGHGGVLDRLDGILIACPLVYFFALYVRPF